MDYLPVILISLFLSAFFSGSEMAFLSSNKLLIELNRKKHPHLAKITDTFIQNQGLFISTILVGNSIALVVYSIYMGHLIEPWIARYFNSDIAILLLQTLFSTLVILFTAEFLPKVLFRINPTLTLNIVSLPLRFFYTLFYPISSFTLSISNFLIRRVLKAPSPPGRKSIVIGRIDLDNLITEHQEKTKSDESVPQEVKFLKNALDFSSVKIRECTIPRTDIEAIEVDDGLDTLSHKFIETGHSKILVFKGNIDNIIGYVHVSALFKQPQSLRNIVSQISIVPETMTANNLLELFTQERKSIALVVDEFGGTAGIVTLEDLLEEIFGEIDDEYDVSDLTEKKIDKGIYQFSGRFEVDYLNDKYLFDLPVSDEYETLAGMVLFYNEAIPKVGEVIEIKNFYVKIIDASSSKIKLLEISFDEKN